MFIELLDDRIIAGTLLHGCGQQPVLALNLLAVELPYGIHVDGTRITKDNAEPILKAYRERFKVYNEAIRSIGYEKVKGTFSVEALRQRSEQEQCMVPELFSENGDAATFVDKVTISQKGPQVTLSWQVPVKGKKRKISLKVLAIKDKLVLRIPNLQYSYYGAVGDDIIELRLDMNEVERVTSMAHASQIFLPKDKQKPLKDLSGIRLSDSAVVLRKK